jgi:hypothetical protein
MLLVVTGGLMAMSFSLRKLKAASLWDAMFLLRVARLDVLAISSCLRGILDVVCEIVREVTAESSFL